MKISRRKPSLVTLDTIAPRDIHWLWYPYIPLGTVTALYGRGGMGKSWITCDIASRLSTGRPLPDQEDQDRREQRVLMLSAEDDYAQVLVPRLTALGANLKNIAVPDFKFTLDGHGAEDVSDLMREFSATVVFIDPIVYYAGGKMDMNKSNEVRAMMEKLKNAAEQSESAVLIVGHIRKSQEGSDGDLMMGSADWINAARSAMFVTKTPDGTRILKHSKTNYGPMGLARAYSLDENGFAWGETYGEDALPTKKNPEGKEKAIAFLKTLLADGPVRASEVMKLAKDENIAPATLNRAKVGVAESYYSTGQKAMCWRLLGQED